jgi:hypothetical protein
MSRALLRTPRCVNTDDPRTVGEQRIGMPHAPAPRGQGYRRDLPCRAQVQGQSPVQRDAPSATAPAAAAAEADGAGAPLQIYHFDCCPQKTKKCSSKEEFLRANIPHGFHT